MHDWQAAMASWQLAYPALDVRGILKQQAQDFKVRERLTVSPSGEGEHVWLNIQKTRLNTEQLAKQLARFAGVENRAVSYSGRKDAMAITQQWFSVWMPGLQDPDWRDLESDQLKVLEVKRHNRKLRLGTHTHNEFNIRIRNLQGNADALSERADAIAQSGVPNYFGPQRFGRGAHNLVQIEALFDRQLKVRDRRQRGLLLSSARSFLFNECLSARIADQSWNQITLGEPVVLAGSDSYFNAEIASANSAELGERLSSGDIHPSCPLIGECQDSVVSRFAELHAREMAICEGYPKLLKGIQSEGMKYARRASRCMPLEFGFDRHDDVVELTFALPRGQFATSVVRELIGT